MCLFFAHNTIYLSPFPLVIYILINIPKTCNMIKIL